MIGCLTHLFLDWYWRRYPQAHSEVNLNIYPSVTLAKPGNFEIVEIKTTSEEYITGCGGMGEVVQEKMLSPAISSAMYFRYKLITGSFLTQIVWA